MFAAMSLVITVIALAIFTNSNLTAGLAGIIEAHALRFDEDIKYFLNNKSVLEQRFISLERCVAFTRSILKPQ